MDEATGKPRPKEIKDLVKDLQSDRTYGRAFSGGGASGSGAGPNNPNPANGEENPWDWRTDAYNLDKQAEILKTDPVRAKQLMERVPPKPRKSLLGDWKNAKV